MSSEPRWTLQNWAFFRPIILLLHFGIFGILIVGNWNFICWWVGGLGVGGGVVWKGEEEWWQWLFGGNFVVCVCLFQTVHYYSVSSLSLLLWWQDVILPSIPYYLRYYIYSIIIIIYPHYSYYASYFPTIPIHVPGPWFGIFVCSITCLPTPWQCHFPSYLGLRFWIPIYIACITVSCCNSLCPRRQTRTRTRTRTDKTVALQWCSLPALHLPLLTCLLSPPATPTCLPAWEVWTPHRVLQPFFCLSLPLFCSSVIIIADDDNLIGTSG